MIAGAFIALLALAGLVWLCWPKAKPLPGPILREPEYHWLPKEAPIMERKPKFEVYQDKRKGWRWRLLSANGRTLCSGESHTRRRDAVRAVETVIETAAKAGIVTA